MKIKDLQSKKEQQLLAKKKEWRGCKYVKREGESCTLNNNCTYPNCEQE